MPQQLLPGLWQTSFPASMSLDNTSSMVITLATNCLGFRVTLVVCFASVLKLLQLQNSFICLLFLKVITSNMYTQYGYHNSSACTKYIKYG